MKFENKEINFKPKPLSENPSLMEKLFEDKKKKIDSFRPKEEDFLDIYSKDEIQADLDDLEKIKSSWEEKDDKEKYLHQISNLYEGVLVDQIEVNSWFGEECETLSTSEYDDVKNGIDAVSIFNGEKYLGLGMDVTFASKIEVLEKKLESIKGKIRTGNLPTLKYFEDLEGKRKKISLPKVIIGSRISSAEKLIKLWGSKEDDRNKQLQNHPVQSKIILETIFQLKYFCDYAIGLSNNTKEEDMADCYNDIALEYAKMYNIFYDIYQNKKDLIKNHLNEISDDIVYKTISSYTKNN
ncbi:MAG: hypothetical protein U9R00_00825 [Patescibacteria group bacterium]|nr:hypothetical protein [Patescibacteria group bacterium]